MKATIERPAQGTGCAFKGFMCNDAMLQCDPTVGLATRFLESAPEARQACFAAVPDLEGALTALVAKGRVAWPALALTAEDFVAFLGRALPESVAGQLAELHGDDLWLVGAFVLGIPGAAEALDGYGFADATRALARLGAPRASIADIMQELRSRLFDMKAPRPGQKVYAGRGSLRGWLRICAVRELNRQRRHSELSLPLEVAPLPAASPEWEPEASLLMKTNKRELSEAFREALASLSSRERNVLRCHFIEELSIDRIGALYGVHRATAARWVNHARETLCKQTYAQTQRRISVSDAEFQGMVLLLESEVHVHLAGASAMAGAAPPQEP
jgi:RNA polymerase sigma-70 factor (ECF subfamily)